MVTSNHDFISIGSVLKKYCNLDWYKGGHDVMLNAKFGVSSSLPRLLWRYSEPNSNLSNRITEVITKTAFFFSGNVKWGVELQGRNWVLAPSDFLSFCNQGGYLQEKDALEHFVRLYPRFSTEANSDVPALLSAIDENLNLCVLV